MTATADPRMASRGEAITQLGGSFKRAMAAVRKLRGRETHRPGQPSFAQYSLLFALDGSDGLSSGELAASADVSPATVTQMLDALVEHGLVTRSRSSSDRRIVTCSLTPSGQALVDDRRTMFEQRWNVALDDISTADLAVAAAVFDRIAGMFDALDADL